MDSIFPCIVKIIVYDKLHAALIIENGTINQGSGKERSGRKGVARGSHSRIRWRLTRSSRLFVTYKRNKIPHRYRQERKKERKEKKDKRNQNFRQ